ncbi:hypothetical protein MVEG_10562 [Podila verticillata NRRL 6337]|nr:hypothetical protein MVEG_10562 [Podila verticillata NRRL 6337]
MGVLVPRCIAANEESIYFVASGQSLNIYKGEKLLVLVKSNRFPSLDSTDTTWNVISLTLASQFNEKQLDYNREKFTCQVNKNGIFTIMAKTMIPSEPTLYRARFDPNAPLASNNRTFNPYNSTHGEWISADMQPPGSYYFTRRTWIHRDTLATTFIQYADSMDRLPPMKTPVVDYGQLNESGLMVIDGIVNQTLSKAAIFNNTNGTMYGMFYGDEQVFATIKTGPQIRSNDTQGDYYNQTLVYFPFKAPYALTSPPEGAKSFQWSLACRNTRDYGAKAGVSKGKLYYFCEHPATPADSTSNLYIFDSATGENLGPYPVSIGIMGERGETDVILAPGPTPFPHSAIIHSEDGNVSFTGLSTSSGMNIAATRLDPTFFSVPDIEEYNPPNTVGRTSAVIWGISAAAAMAFMILCFWSLHQYKRRQAQRNAVVLPVENAGVYRPGEEIDFELPAYTSTPEYANYIHPEDLAHIQRVNNLSLANQESNNPPGEVPEEGGANADVSQAEGDATGSEASLDTPSSESPSTIIAITSEDIPTDEPPAYYKDDDDRP